MIKIVDKDMLDAFQDRLYECLGKSIRTGQLIDTTGLRQIGKTTTLINFARSFGLPVIVATVEMAKVHRELSGYKDIYSATSDLRGVGFKRVMVDEYVNTKRLEDMGFDILGGYQTYC